VNLDHHHHQQPAAAAASTTDNSTLSFYVYKQTLNFVFIVFPQNFLFEVQKLDEEEEAFTVYFHRSIVP